MHKSRLSGFIIDCDTDDLEAAAAFWGAALGAPPREPSDEDGLYVGLEVPAGEPYVEVQKVSHESRVHIDIEADDIEAEVARLVKLGAKRIADIRGWVVLEAPTGQRFCVVPVVRDGFDEKANSWGD
jgi:predicted enzyme related to lactoylglutathione lyase